MSQVNYVISMALGAAFGMILAGEEPRGADPVPVFQCQAVEDAWTQYRTGFDKSADRRIMRLLNNQSHSYYELKRVCESSKEDKQ